MWVRTPNVSWLRELRPHVTIEGFGSSTASGDRVPPPRCPRGLQETASPSSPATNVTLEGVLGTLCAQQIVIPAGTYENTILSWRWNTDQERAAGTAVAGLRWFLARQTPSATQRNRHTTKGPRIHQWVLQRHHSPMGSFITNLGQLRFNYHFTPACTSNPSFNDAADLWSANLRFTWLHTASTVSCGFQYHRRVGRPTSRTANPQLHRQVHASVDILN